MGDGWRWLLLLPPRRRHRFSLTPSRTHIRVIRARALPLSRTRLTCVCARAHAIYMYNVGGGGCCTKGRARALCVLLIRRSSVVRAGVKERSQPVGKRRKGGEEGRVSRADWREPPPRALSSRAWQPPGLLLSPSLFSSASPETFLSHSRVCYILRTRKDARVYIRMHTQAKSSLPLQALYTCTSCMYIYIYTRGREGYGRPRHTYFGPIEEIEPCQVQPHRQPASERASARHIFCDPPPPLLCAGARRAAALLVLFMLYSRRGKWVKFYGRVTHVWIDAVARAFCIYIYHVDGCVFVWELGRRRAGGGRGMILNERPSDPSSICSWIAMASLCVDVFEEAPRARLFSVCLCIWWYI